MAPSHVANDSVAGQLTLHWSDGRVQTLSHAGLRAACRCAFCRTAQMSGTGPAASCAVRVIALNPMGYGAQLVFSDGHDRGIFPWVYLAGLDEPGT